MNRPRHAYGLTTHRGDCDCCGKTRDLTRVVYQGMDTDACNECRGMDPADEDLTADEIAELFA